MMVKRGQRRLGAHTNQASPGAQWSGAGLERGAEGAEQQSGDMEAAAAARRASPVARRPQPARRWPQLRPQSLSDSSELSELPLSSPLPAAASALGSALWSSWSSPPAASLSATCEGRRRRSAGASLACCMARL